MTEGWCHEGDALNELPMTEDKPDLSVSIRAKNIRFIIEKSRPLLLNCYSQKFFLNLDTLHCLLSVA